MAPPSSLASKLKVQLKLSVSRLRMTQQKDIAIAKQQRRAMAQLLEQGKVESARIRVENIIRSDITTELHEVIELYCELLLARIQLLDPPQSISGYTSSKSNPYPTPDPGLDEAICSLIYAAPRTEIKELHAVRALLVEKFGKDYALAAMEEKGVSERVLEKLKIEAPKRVLVDAYLGEIARTYQIDWPPGSLNAPESDVQGAGVDDDDDGGDDDNPSGGQKIKIAEEPIPSDPGAKPEPAPKPKSMGTGKGGPGGNVPDSDDLSARFAALLRK